MKKVLICPLDWGLGHATRCIPVILELRHRGVEVLIASSGGALELLKLEFPTNTFFELPGYKPRYSADASMAMTLIRQLPKFYKAIKSEHVAVERIVQQQNIDVVISDNRYGCWSSRAASVFITHQIKVLMPGGWEWTARLVNYFLWRAVQKFNTIWVPDNPESKLTTPFIPNQVKKLRYVGWLSRFTPRVVPKHYEIVALVSGPEPQRAIFEQLLRLQLTSLGKKALLVTGEPNRPFHTTVGNLEAVNHLNTHDLEEAILSSDIVIARSGYSTVMDMFTLGKKAIFVPTPQQPEQLYLANLLSRQSMAVSELQEDFSLKRALDNAGSFSGLKRSLQGNELLNSAIDAMLK